MLKTTKALSGGDDRGAIYTAHMLALHTQGPLGEADSVSSVLVWSRLF